MTDRAQGKSEILKAESRNCGSDPTSPRLRRDKGSRAERPERKNRNRKASIRVLRFLVVQNLCPAQSGIATAPCHRSPRFGLERIPPHVLWRGVGSRGCTAKLAVIVTDYWLPDLCFLRFRTDAGTRQSLTGTVQSPTGAMKSPAMFWLCRAQCAGRKEHGVRSLARGAKGRALPAGRLNPNSEARPPRALLAAPSRPPHRKASFAVVMVGGMGRTVCAFCRWNVSRGRKAETFRRWNVSRHRKLVICRSWNGNDNPPPDTSRRRNGNRDYPPGNDDYPPDTFRYPQVNRDYPADTFRYPQVNRDYPLGNDDYPAQIHRRKGQ